MFTEKVPKFSHHAQHGAFISEDVPDHDCELQRPVTHGLEEQKRRSTDAAE